MLRNSWVLLALAISGVSIAENKKADLYTSATIDVHPDCDPILSNIVSNCGFESGGFFPWTQSGDTSFTGVDGFARHSGDFGAFFGPSALGFISQVLPTVPGHAYDISFWLRNFGQPSEFQLSWNGSVISDWINVGNFIYTQVSFPGLVALGTTTEIKFGFRNVPDFFYLDDIVVEEAI